MQTILYAVESKVETFIDKVHSLEGISKSELKNMWKSATLLSPSNAKPSKSSKKKEIDKSIVPDLDMNNILTLTVPELKAMCKSKSLKVSGKKSELINRLLGKKEDSELPTVEKKKDTKGKKDKKKDELIPKAKILELIKKNIKPILVRKNRWRNFEHPQTELVFDNECQKVIGRQMDDGTISELNEQDIQNCKRYDFAFDLPENLDSKLDMNTVKIDELDELLSKKVDDGDIDEEEGDDSDEEDEEDAE